MAKDQQQQHLCRCGCGAPVRHRYAPGHDSRHVSQLAQAVRHGDLNRKSATAQLDSNALKQKLRSQLG